MIERYEKKEIVTIDGPAGSGKSTLAKILAQKIDWTYCNTGSMYRLVTLAVLEEGIGFDDEKKIVDLCASMEMTFDENFFYWRGKNVTKDLTRFDVTENVSAVAAITGVRRTLVEWQKQRASKGKVVMEGRDMGTVVFPDARYKFYLDASIDQRVDRRLLELKAKGENFSKEEIKVQMVGRDKQDSYRMDSPLTIPFDAVVIDSTEKSIPEVLENMSRFFPEEYRERICV
ncbi:cytidylate kinase [PVC group bacterium (ex Bugula neritina AB1)]|nr:cytidylate kinase [PVC group bacterium (ex Bugula neritina AB1)]